VSVYDSIDSQRGMLFDKPKNQAYLDAIRQAVTHNSVVLDLGAGLGFFGLAAAKAGARKVYLVDPSPVIELARKIAIVNNLSNVECIRGTIEEVELPEQVDIIISVFTGNFLLTEDLLPSLFYARDQFLKPGAMLIPEAARMVSAPVSNQDFYDKHLKVWSKECSVKALLPDEHCEIDFSAGLTYAANSLYYVAPKEFTGEYLAEPQQFHELDFYTTTTADCDARIEAQVSHSAICHGWAGWFEMKLGENWLSTSPKAAAMHWSSVYLPADPPVAVASGDAVSLHLIRAEFGEWHWNLDFPDGTTQRHSSFLSMPLRPQDIARASEGFAPVIQGKLEPLRWLVETMDGKKTIRALAEALSKQFPARFSNLNQAINFIKSVLARFD